MHNNLRNIEYQIKTSDNPRLWFEIHLTGLLGNQKINSFENKQESKNNTTEENDKSRKSTAIFYKENISNEIQKPSAKKEITRDESIEKKDEKYDVLEKESIENISDNHQNNLGSNDLKDKWELILSKVELPSTRMLLSQQAELESFDSEKITIALSPNLSLIHI